MPFEFKLRPGEDFYIGHERFVLGEHVSGDVALVIRQRDGRAFTLRDEQRTEIAPETWATAKPTLGAGTGHRRIRVLAPRYVVLLRGDLYRRAGGRLGAPGRAGWGAAAPGVLGGFLAASGGPI